jgi:hypothetical protein
MSTQDVARILLLRATEAEKMAGRVRMIAAALRAADLGDCVGPAPDELRSRLGAQVNTAMYYAHLVEETAEVMRDHARAVAGSSVGRAL